MRLSTRPLFQPLVIIIGCTLAAVAYGLVHDQVTIRLCPEYFTVSHPRITNSQSLTVIALAWGVQATWWVGATLGLLVAVAARAGSEPRVGGARLVRPVLALLAANGACALGAGVAGYVLACAGVIGLAGELAADVPAEMHPRYLSAWWAHISSYALGGVGGLALVVWTLRTRWKMRGVGA